MPRFPSLRSAATRCLIAVCVGAFLAGAGSAHGATATAPVVPPAGFFGASGGLPSAGILTQLAASGAGEYRTDASWPTAEPSAPVGGTATYDWASFDQTAGALAAAGLRWYPILDYTPAWASSDGTEFGPPKDPTQFAAYAAAFAERYGPGGSFWSANPALQYLPVQEYEIWNEEDASEFWDEQSSAPAAYSTLLADSESAIHAAQPSATVVLGGLLDAGSDALGFLAAMQKAHPGILASVGAVAYHPYQENLQTTLSRIVALRALLVSDGAAGVPIEVTETDGNDAFMAGSSWSSDLTTLAGDLAGSNCDVTRFFPYMGTSVNAGESDADNTGWFVLFTANGTPSDIGSAYLTQIHTIVTSGTPATSLCAAAHGSSAGTHGVTAGASGSKNGVAKKHHARSRRHHKSTARTARP